MSEELANTVYLGGIPEDVTVEQIKHLFITFGEIKSVDLPIDSETLKNRGFAFIEYEDIEDAEAAIDNYDEGELFGKIVKVKPAKPYKPKSFYTKPVWHSEDWQRKNNEEYTYKERVRREKQKKRDEEERKKEEEKAKKYQKKQ
ncbi:unnamed protein product (macronuclear) [Paramecium tetraurelia]|nr:uncharacterized protein GSPATT00023983001 [Paramecium tetraurelia]CAK91255.1 unnamed protein product [Paramecium tetraurelia]|eukprot:XP_001458652.1 hypothetical protein (macronuclear) [Paramecium tetraurelia strain d4-2]